MLLILMILLLRGAAAVKPIHQLSYASDLGDVYNLSCGSFSVFVMIYEWAIHIRWFIKIISNVLLVESLPAQQTNWRRQLSHIGWSKPATVAILTCKQVKDKPPANYKIRWSDYVTLDNCARNLLRTLVNFYCKERMHKFIKPNNRVCVGVL